MKPRYTTPEHMKKFYEGVDPEYAEEGRALINEFLEKFDPGGSHEPNYMTELLVRLYLKRRKQFSLNLPEHLWNYHILVAIGLIERDLEYEDQHIPEGGFIPSEVRQAWQEQCETFGIKKFWEEDEDEDTGRGEKTYYSH